MNMNHIATSQLLLCFLCGIIFGLSGCWMIWNPLNLSGTVVKQDRAIITCSLPDTHTLNRPENREDTEVDIRDATIPNYRPTTRPVTPRPTQRAVSEKTLDEKLFHNVRVLCWIMTHPKNLREKAIHVNATWGRRCNKLLFASDFTDNDFPTINITVAHGRNHLTAKTMQTFDYIYKHHFNDADWFLKADDDTYVIMENLRYMLSPHSPAEPVFFGQHFRPKVHQGYFSGGAGYVLSKEALRRFGRREGEQCAQDHGYEDVEMGKCMEALDVVPGDSRDALNRTRFHCLTLDLHTAARYPEWYHFYIKYRVPDGPTGMSDLPVSFHYVEARDMYIYEYLVYHLRPYGFQDVHQDLNPKYVNYSMLTMEPKGNSGSGGRTN